MFEYKRFDVMFDEDHFFLLNFIKIADMLSIPYSLLAPSLASSSCSNSYKTSPKALQSLILFLTHLTISSEVFTSQMPSHPIITN